MVEILPVSRDDDLGVRAAVRRGSYAISHVRGALAGASNEETGYISGIFDADEAD